ncbi:MAG: GlsB/YeaQ/YmgE family stress response membrane protein [Xanthobacteraceae bacterium]
MKKYLATVLIVGAALFGSPLVSEDTSSLCQAFAVRAAALMDIQGDGPSGSPNYLTMALVGGHVSPQARAFIVALVIGVVVGGIAALSAKGSGLVIGIATLSAKGMIYITAGVVGSFVGRPLLEAIGIYIDPPDPLVGYMIPDIFGAIALVIVVRVIFAFIPA